MNTLADPLAVERLVRRFFLEAQADLEAGEEKPDVDYRAALG